MNSNPDRQCDDHRQAPLLRSSAVARMVPMPVATLRIWEQRYQAVRPRTLASGHRRYSADDVQRLRWLRELVAQGHAIGALAGLENPQLQQLLLHTPGVASVPPRQVMVVGAALGARLLRPTLGAQWPQPIKLAAVWAALPAVPLLSATTTAGADLLIWHMAGLHSAVPESLLAVRAALPALHVAVVYRYAGATALAAFAAAGIALLREPVEDGQLAAWLAALPASQAAPAPLAAWPAMPAVAPRRYDEAALTAVIAMQAPLLCECPCHIAELLLQLAHFEQYSADCRHDSPADAALHAQLQQVAAASRSLFEAALERVLSHADMAGNAST